MGFVAALNREPRILYAGRNHRIRRNVMFDHIRQAIAEQRRAEQLRSLHGRRLTARGLADRDAATEAPRWRVLTRADQKVTLLWEVAPGWYMHAWGDHGEVEVHDDVASATVHSDQNMNLMTGKVKKDLHPDWDDADWEQARVDGNHKEFEELAAAGFDITQESEWTN
jgi:hypothetical protein